LTIKLSFNAPIPLIREGKFRVRVKSVEGLTSQSGTPGIRVEFETPDNHTISDKFYLTEKAAGRLSYFLKCLGWTEEDLAGGVKRSKIVDRPCIIEVEKHRNPDTYKTFYEIISYAPDDSGSLEEKE
jgi:hypothetical protein